MKNLILILFFIFTNLFSQTVIINELMSSNSTVLQDTDGDYSDWIEIYNPTSSTINLNGFTISDDLTKRQKWTFPNVDILKGDYLIVFASNKNRAIAGSELHTNFKIKSSGEIIVLSDATGQLVDQVYSAILETDISLGRNINNISEWLLYTTATPASANTTSGVRNYSEEPVFSIAGGFYSNNVSVSLSTTYGLANIYYTLDGSEPTESSTQFSTSLSISQTTVLRAKSFTSTTLPSKVFTNTYFINESSTFPVISLSTNPDNFFNDEIGIYVTGVNGRTWHCSNVPNNWSQPWERPINIEYFNTDGTLGFNENMGVAIFGGCSRTLFKQKSLRLKARGKYGAKTLDFPLFNGMSSNKYDSFVLRNSGNDNRLTHFRDALMQSLVDSLDLEKLAFTPSNVFLNGDYFGVYNVREKINEDYIAQHQNIDPKNIELLKIISNVFESDGTNFLNLLDYCENNDLSIQSNYDYVASQIEITNLIDYFISEMYFANDDWYFNNVRVWRPKVGEGKWRWILFDTDFGFDLFANDYHNLNMFEIITNPKNIISALFNGLKKNNNFKYTFINTFADYTNTIFSASVVNSKIDSMQNLFAPEILRHFIRWEPHLVPGNDLTNWYNEVSRMKTFANARISPMQDHFINEFGLAGVAKLNLNVNNSDKGYVKLNRIKVKEFPWSGEYFKGIPIIVKAISKVGNKFLNWSENNVIVSTNSIYTFTPNANTNIIANFQSSLTDVETQNELKNNFYLSQNFPNPFNPSTTISFGVQQKSNVRLEVFNTLGQLVRTVTNKYYSSGQYTITWDGKDNFGKKVNSGIYIYRIYTNNFIDSKRMILLK